MVKIRKSTRKNKKYMAIFPDDEIVHFGDNRYKQYKDGTNIAIYEDLNHGDPKRRLNYFKRHFPKINWNMDTLPEKREKLLSNLDKKSAEYLSAKYLW